MSYKNYPKGFNELIECFESNNTYELSTSEIQDYMRKKYNMTSGAITGTIKRAKDSGIIELLSRSHYRYINPMIRDDASNFDYLLNSELETCINKIKGLIAKNFENLTDHQIYYSRNIIDNLNSIIQKY